MGRAERIRVPSPAASTTARQVRVADPGEGGEAVIEAFRRLAWAMRRLDLAQQTAAGKSKRLPVRVRR
jgi:hypothetical protein